MVVVVILSGGNESGLLLPWESKPTLDLFLQKWIILNATLL